MNENIEYYVFKLYNKDIKTGKMLKNKEIWSTMTADAYWIKDKQREFETLWPGAYERRLDKRRDMVSGKKKFIRKQLFYFYYNNYESSTFRNIMVSFDP